MRITKFLISPQMSNQRNDFRSDPVGPGNCPFLGRICCFSRRDFFFLSFLFCGFLFSLSSASSSLNLLYKENSKVNFGMIRKLKICEGCQEPRQIWKNIGGKRYCRRCAQTTEELTCTKSEEKPTRAYRIPAHSSKRADQEREYKIERRIYLDQNPICDMKILGLCTTKATTVQHLKGRIGDLLLNKEFWMPACWPCHSYADTHPAEAIENGWALPRLS